MAAGVSPEHWVESTVSIRLTPEPNQRIPTLVNQALTGRLAGVSEYGVVLEIVSYSEGEQIRDVSFFPWVQVGSMWQVDESEIVS